MPAPYVCHPQAPLVVPIIAISPYAPITSLKPLSISHHRPPSFVTDEVVKRLSVTSSLAAWTISTSDKPDTLT